MFVQRRPNGQRLCGLCDTWWTYFFACQTVCERLNDRLYLCFRLRRLCALRAHQLTLIKWSVARHPPTRPFCRWHLLGKCVVATLFQLARPQARVPRVSIDFFHVRRGNFEQWSARGQRKSTRASRALKVEVCATFPSAFVSRVIAICVWTEHIFTEACCLTASCSQ